MSPDSFRPAQIQMSRRGILQFGAIAAGFATLAACGGPGGSSSSAEGGTAVDLITVGTAATAGSMNPLDEQYSTLQFNVYDSLVRVFADDDEPQPRIAKSWEESGKNTWTFTLRPDVKFHDGTTVTAQDVAFSFDTLMAEQYANAITLMSITSVKALDDSTVEVVTSGPDPLLMSRLSALFVVPKAHWEKTGGGTKFAQDPIGSGPFKVESYSADTGAKLTAFEDFWDGAPATATVDLKFFSDASALALALQSGEVDVAHQLTTAQYPTLDGDKNLALSAKFGGTQNMLQLKTTSGPFKDLKVRQAAIAAIDAAALVEGLTHGLAEIEDGQLPLKEVNGYTDSITRPAYDLEKAKSLLAEAGATGAEITITGMTLYRQLLEAIGEQLTAAGFKPTIKALEISEWVEQFTGGSDADIFYRGVAYTGVFDVDRAFSMVSFGKKPAVKDAKWDTLFAATRAETDPAARLEKIAAASQYLNDQAYILWSYANPSISAATTQVSGTDFNQGLVIPLEGLVKKA
ncbi:ABC transporter substrate-binding protein [Kineosporia sp. NBRC 101731]|uniref:ABC transporter substrate-binding protein n=1 Tax=Kineosporia sp. NBRC 101731 TaxID=3032199 RepID=UPI0024A17819|nr:ABC transporter substrate-binding protein [Kineosporia sp. NBRC 101731]GLY29642.1 diguanylate phosphodiesterase [Kineosporia sp. NBRC 101731]